MKVQSLDEALQAKVQCAGEAEEPSEPIEPHCPGCRQCVGDTEPARAGPH